jgi:Methyltransferase domain
MSGISGDACGSIETEQPYWLDEAYAIPGVHIDVGVASRTVKNWVALETLFSCAGVARDAFVLDFGAASGLLARLMRDVGYDVRSYDKYTTASFTSYFNVELNKTSCPAVLTAFEVFEHFAQPAQELTALLDLRPELVVFTTWFCDGQDENWIYFVEDCGQHVFFYTEKSLRDFVDRLGYDLVLTSFFHVLVRRETCERLRHGVGEVAFRNAYIDADFEVAQQLFRTELDEGCR